MTVYLKDTNEEEVYVDEGESCSLISTFEFDGVPFDKDAILTLSLTLFDKQTETVINSREEQNVFDTNDGTVASDGTVVVNLKAADNIIVGSLATDEIEEHVARLEWTWSDGVELLNGKVELVFYVRKLAEPS